MNAAGDNCTAAAPLAYSRAMPAAAPGRLASDEDLMQAYAAGEAGAFDTLYARHKGGVYRYLLRHCAAQRQGDDMCRPRVETHQQQRDIRRELRNAIRSFRLR